MLKLVASWDRVAFVVIVGLHRDVGSGMPCRRISLVWQAV